MIKYDLENKAMSLLKNSIVLGTFEWDVSNNQIVFYDDLHKLFGVEEKKFRFDLDEALKILIPERDIKKGKALFKGLTKKNTFEPIELRGLTCDGREKWVKIIGDFEYDSIGEKKSIFGVIIDMTESKEVEENLNSLITLRDSVLHIAHSVMDTSNLFTLFDIILENALKSIYVGEIGSVLIMDEVGDLTIAAYRGFENTTAKKFKINIKESFIYKKNNGNVEKPALVNDTNEMLDVMFTDFLNSADGMIIKSAISVPIMIDGKLYGLLNVDSYEKDVFTENDLELLEYLSLHASIAIEKHLLYEKTIKLSRYDELTGISNRRYFQTLFNNEISRAQRYNEKFSLVLLDLNKFKVINDTYGHLIGDEVLINFANLLKLTFRQSDIVGRLGGDEFIAVILHSEEHQIISKMENLMSKCRENLISVGDESFGYDFSFGISCYPRDGKDYNSLVREADKKMYKQKYECRKYSCKTL